MLWAVSLLLPVAVVTRDDIWYGWMVLAFGWLALLFGQLGWLANLVFLPATVVAMTVVQPPRWLRIGFALVLASLTIGALLWREVTYDNGTHAIQSFGAGYYLWCAAMLGCVVWQIAALRTTGR